MSATLIMLSEAASVLSREGRAACSAAFCRKARNLKTSLLQAFPELSEAIPKQFPGHGVMGLKIHRDAITRQLEANLEGTKLSGIQGDP